MILFVVYAVPQFEFSTPTFPAEPCLLPSRTTLSKSQILTPVVSHSCALPLSQPLSFDILPHCPGVYLSEVCSRGQLSPNPGRINTCKSATKQTTLSSFRIRTYEKPGGAADSSAQQLAAPLAHQANPKLATTRPICSSLSTTSPSLATAHVQRYSCRAKS